MVGWENIATIYDGYSQREVAPFHHPMNLGLVSHASAK